MTLFDYGKQYTESWKVNVVNVGCSEVDLYYNISLYFVETTSDISYTLTNSHRHAFLFVFM